MTRISVALGVAAIAAVTFVGGCGEGNEQPAAGEGEPAASAPAAPAAEESQEATITYSSDPNPPRMGDNAFEVMVTDESGQPVTDADVSVEFYMAAMPEMNMAEMRNRIDLTHEGGGRYRGTGNVIMGGDWDVTVTARRGGEEIGRRTLDVTAQQ